MKKKIVLIVMLFLLVFIYKSDKANFEITTVTLSGENTVEMQRKALIETAHAYYRQGTQVQYDSYRKNIYASPEDATSQHTVYTVCSGFTYQTYYQTFGIKLPETVDGLLDYAKKYQSEDVTNKFNSAIMPNNSSAVLLYYDNSGEIYSGDVLGTSGKAIPPESFYEKFISVVEPGDIFVVTGHAMLIESVDKENKTAIVIESGFGSGEGAYDLKNHCERYEVDGSIRRIDLRERLGVYTWYYGDESAIERMCLIRIINNDRKYINSSGKMEDYKITDSANARIKMPNIDIEKTIKISNDSGDDSQYLMADLGDTLTYTITIKNLSAKSYENVDIVEKVDSNLSVLNTVGAEISGDVIKWVIPTIEPGGSITKSYSVRVPNNKALYGKVIVSEGTVGNISTSKIETLIGKKLSKEYRNKLWNECNVLLSEKVTERDFINEIYKRALGIDIGLTNLKGNVKHGEILGIMQFDDSVPYGGSYYDVIHSRSTEIVDTTIKGYVYQNFYGMRIAEDYDEHKNLVRSFMQWSIKPSYEFSDRARTLTKDMLLDGDILLTYAEESGEFKNKAYIYFGNTLLRKIGYDENENLEIVEEIFDVDGDNKLSEFLMNLACDNYIILRPSINAFNYIVNGKYYPTLESAYRAISENAGTIVVNMDNIVESSNITIESGKEITLDLNGKTLTKTIYAIKNKGKLIITDNSALDGKLTTTDDFTRSLTSTLILNLGSIIVENGVVVHVGSNTVVDSPQWYTIANYNESERRNCYKRWRSVSRKV